MSTYAIWHDDADGPMFVKTESDSKAKYRNYLDWKDAFGRGSFLDYLKGLRSCKKFREAAE